jgi:hypothetical protein
MDINVAEVIQDLSEALEGVDHNLYPDKILAHYGDMSLSDYCHILKQVRLQGLEGLSEADIILEHMKNIGPISHVDATLLYKITRLAASIKNLREKGIGIKTNELPTSRGGTFAMYELTPISFPATAYPKMI